MAKSELVCPTCNADVPMAGDERSGDEVFCAVCSARCVFRDPDGGDSELVEDY